MKKQIPSIYLLMIGAILTFISTSDSIAGNDPQDEKENLEAISLEEGNPSEDSVNRSNQVNLPVPPPSYSQASFQRKITDCKLDCSECNCTLLLKGVCCCGGLGFFSSLFCAPVTVAHIGCYTGVFSGIGVVGWCLERAMGRFECIKVTTQTLLKKPRILHSKALSADQTTCPICTDDYVVRNEDQSKIVKKMIVLTPCNQPLCETCYLKLLENNQGVCPFCREALPQEGTVDVFQGLE